MVTEKRVRQYKGWIIAMQGSVTRHEYRVYCGDEWSFGKGLRYAEFECSSIQECMDNIDSY